MDDMTLPPGWVNRTINEIYDVIGGGTPSTTVDEYWYGDISWITSADIHDLKDIRPRKKITHRAIKESATNLVPAGTIIVVTRVSLGKVAITPFPLCFSQDSQALIPKNNEIIPEYSLYYLSLATQSFKHQSRGTTISGVTKKQLKDLRIPIPPLPEQERIVARIESLFTQLDAGVAGLKRAQAALKRYRLSVLKAACEGRLVPQDPNEEPAEELLKRILAEKGEKAEIITGTNGDLPLGWIWAKVEQLTTVGTGATPLRSKSKYYQNGTIPWVTSGALNNSFVDRTEEYITPIALRETNAKIFPSGTLLVAMYGEGKTRGKVSELRINAATNQACAGLVFTGENINCKPFVKMFFQKNYEDIRRLSSGGVQPNLNLGLIKRTTLPFPPMEEQRRIVAEVERRLSIAIELEQVISASLKRAARLRQAILKRAFVGRLVEQRPNYKKIEHLLDKKGENNG